MKIRSHALFATLFLCISAQIVCMQLEEPNQSYFNACKNIDEENETKLNKFILHVCENKEIDRTGEIENIKLRLNQLQESIEAKKQNALRAIKRKHNISGNVWASCIRVDQHLYNFMQKSSSFDLPTIIHDENMPANLLSMLKSNLIKNKFNPKQFNLQLTQEDIATQIGAPILYWCILNDILEIKLQGPGKIVINEKNIGAFSEEQEENICTFIIQSLLARKFNPIECIKGYTGLNIDPDNSVSKYIEKLSLLNASLNNKYTAEKLKSYWEIRYSTSFSKNDYKQLSKICRLHKSLEWLKENTIDYIEKPLTMNDNENSETQCPTKTIYL